VNMAWMLGDGAPLLLFGALLGLSLTTGGDSKKKFQSVGTVHRTSIFFVLAIPAVFFAGRLLSYTVVNVYSAFSLTPVTTLEWVVLFGVTVGILYYWLRPAVMGASRVSTAIFFGLVMFGLDMFIFNFAYFLIVATNFTMVADFFARISIDVLSLTGGVLLYESLRDHGSNVPVGKGLRRQLARSTVTK
jgi:hypothetical protein